MSEQTLQTHPGKVDRQAHRWVMKMLDDPTHHARALESWLSKDATHREVFKRVSIEVGYASDAAMDLPNLKIAHREVEQPRSPFRMLGFGLAGACAAASALVATALWNPAIHPMNATAPVASPLRAAEPGNRRSIALSDGSKVMLLSNASVDVHFSRSERSIRLNKGWARFAVEHDPSRPFVVYVTGGKVTAVGTLFEVDASASSPQVHLISGTVIVTTLASNRGSPPSQVVLKAGETTAISLASPIAARADGSGSQGEYESFDNVPLDDVVRRLNKQSSRRIVLSDPTMGRQLIFAEIDPSNIEGVAEQLAEVAGGRVDSATPSEIRISRAH